LSIYEEYKTTVECKDHALIHNNYSCRQIITLTA